jgi:hypothetical protein
MGNVTDRPPPPPISAAEQAAKDAHRALHDKAVAWAISAPADVAAYVRQRCEDAAHTDQSVAGNLRGLWAELGLP